MRRIIERVVTVVTTTTWTITWKDDPLPSDHRADPATPADSQPASASLITEHKEADPLKDDKK